MATCFITISYYFNSRPSARGDSAAAPGSRLSGYFNSRPSARGDASPALPRPAGAGYFNSRPSARGDAGIGGFILDMLFQFTPLREGRLQRIQIIEPVLIISIHAPPRGATETPERKAEDDPISIHAPPRGATRHTPHKPWHGRHFNSRPSARGDFRLSSVLVASRISIHAPPRGATGLPRRDRQGGGISIHAPPRGATAKDMQFLQIFCSTLTNQHGLTIVPRNLSRLFW